MKKLLIWMLLVAVLAGLPAFFCCAEGAAEEPADGETAEWTVLFYLCGADLESKYGFATATLEEIRHVSYPYNMIPIYTAETVSISDMMRDIGKVNLLIETGGEGTFHYSLLDPAMEYIRKHHFRLCGNPYGILLIRSHDERGFHRYFDFYLPISDE